MTMIRDPWAPLPPSPPPAPRRRTRLVWLLAVAGTALAWLPLLSVVLCATLAGALGCQVDEGSVHPCMLGGVDIGPTLYVLGVMGWLMLATAPFMLLSIVFWLGAALRFLWRRWRGATGAT